MAARINNWGLLVKFRMIAALVALCAAGAAEAKLFTAQWSGARFENSAVATAVFDIDTAVYPAALVDFGFSGSFPNPAFHLVSLTVSGAETGNGTFFEDSYTNFYFNADSLDFSQQLIGQIMSNDCAFGSFDELCYGGGSGDFNLLDISESARSVFARGSGAPVGTNYFVLTTDLGGGESLALVSLAAAVPEPATWALMIGGFAMTGAAMRRRQAMHAA